MKIKSIGVFCSASFGKENNPYYNEAVKLGQAIAKSGYKLVYGGSATGLMGAVARTARDNGAQVLGVMTRSVAQLEPVLTGIKILEMPDILRRKDALIENADAFLILAGGIGTLNETFQLMVEHQVAEQFKPIIFVNTNGVYDKLLDYLRFLTEEKFISDLTLERLNMYEVKNTQEAFEFINQLNRGINLAPINKSNKGKKR